MWKKICLASICGLGAGIAVFLIAQSLGFPTRLNDGRLVPPWGVAANPNSDQPIHPEEVEQDFKAIYKSIIAFRAATKRLPRASSELLDSLGSIPGVNITKDDFLAADVAKSDAYAQGRRDHLEHKFLTNAKKRPQGKQMPDFPKEGEKDAWVFSDVYVRQNATLYPNGQARGRPEGFFIVLWSTGEVERVPVGSTYYVSEADGLTEYFPGQTGLPKNAMKATTFSSALSRAVPAGMLPEKGSGGKGTR